MHNQWPSCLNASCGVSFYMGSKLHWHLERKRVYCHVKRALTSDSSAPMTHVFLYLYMEPGANTVACSAWKVHQLCCDNNMIHWTGFRTYCAEQGMGDLICSASLLWDVPFWRGGGEVKVCLYTALSRLPQWVPILLSENSRRADWDEAVSQGSYMRVFS